MTETVIPPSPEFDLLEGEDDQDFSITPVGLGFRVRFVSYKAQFNFDRLRDTRQGLVCELGVVDGRGSVPLSVAEANLTSLTHRTQFPRLLQQVASRPPDEWAKMVEWAFVAVIREHRNKASQAEVFLDEVVAAPKPIMLLGPILPEGAPTLVYAAGGTGKSTFAAGIAVSVATGEEIIPSWHPLRSNVLVLDWESNAGDWHNKTSDVAHAAGIDPPHIVYRNFSEGGTLADHVYDIASTITRNHIGLIIVDSVGLACGANPDNSEASTSALRMFAALRSLQVTTLLLDHVAGESLGNDNANVKAYGSVYKMNLPRQVFELHREHEGVVPTELMLRNTKTNIGPKLDPIGLKIYIEDGIIGFGKGEITAPELTKHLPMAEQIARLLGERGAMTRPEIVQELGVVYDRVKMPINRGVKSGRFVALDGGRIGLAR